MLPRRSVIPVRSLAKYAQVSAEALMRHQADRDPARRRLNGHAEDAPTFAHSLLTCADNKLS